MRIRVIKSDRTVESYLHTQVLGTFHHALSAGGSPDLFAAEQMAQAVTFFLYSRPQNRTVSADEIHLMIQAVLQDTGFGSAAQALNEHRGHRKLRRKRIEVIEESAGGLVQTVGWSKSVIVEHLIRQYRLSRPLARVIAGSVEEKILRMGLVQIRKGLIRELVEAETETMLRAEEQLNIAL
jgi:hypothetical protein